MGILARLRLAKIRTMARPNTPDMPPKRTKKVRLGISIDIAVKREISMNVDMFVGPPQIIVIGEIMGRLHRFYNSTALFTDHLIQCSVFV